MYVPSVGTVWYVIGTQILEQINESFNTKHYCTWNIVVSDLVIACRQLEPWTISRNQLWPILIDLENNKLFK